MDNSWVMWLFILESILQYPQPVNDDVEEVTRLRMEARAKFLEEEKIRLERELEELAWQQSIWRHLLWSALQHWQVWAPAVLLLLLLALWYMWRKRSQRREGQEGPEAAANEEDVGNAGEDHNDVNGEANNNDNGHAQGVDNVAANEEGADGNEEGAVENEEGAVGNEEGAVGNEEGAVGNEEGAVGNEVVNADVGNEDDYELDNMRRMVMEHTQWPEQDLLRGRQWVTELMDNLPVSLTLYNSFCPVLQRAIGVGSAFEGWSPYDEDVVYQVLIPMSPPRGHSFHLEPAPAKQGHERTFRVHVQLECTCTRREEGEDTLCFLHPREEELRDNRNPSLLDTLCTESYLDVEKTVQWFYHRLGTVWWALPQSHDWDLVQLPTRRSCQFKVNNGRESYWIELLFGVQQGSSDIFVSSQPMQASSSSSTTWPECYAVAEMKFLNFITRLAPQDSSHLKCLELFTHLPLGLSFSTYTIKTIVMHLLNTMPVSQWCRRNFVSRLTDISEFLRKCVEGRRLDHFILGNWWIPSEVTLSPEVLSEGPFNLFHDLVTDLIAHSQAMRQYAEVQTSLREMLVNEQ